MLFDNIRECLQSGRIGDAEVALCTYLWSDSARSDIMRFVSAKPYYAFGGDQARTLGMIRSVQFSRSDSTTACINLTTGVAQIGVVFYLNYVQEAADLIFLVLHERDHLLISRVLRWEPRIKSFGNKYPRAVNFLEDCWINVWLRQIIPTKLTDRFYLKEGVPLEKREAVPLEMKILAGDVGALSELIQNIRRGRQVPSVTHTSELVFKDCYRKRHPRLGGRDNSVSNYDFETWMDGMITLLLDNEVPKRIKQYGSDSEGDSEGQGGSGSPEDGPGQNTNPQLGSQHLPERTEVSGEGSGAYGYRKHLPFPVDPKSLSLPEDLLDTAKHMTKVQRLITSKQRFHNCWSNIAADVRRVDRGDMYCTVVVPPASLSRRDAFMMGCGTVPTLFQQKITPETDSSQVVMYVDVSGSMTKYLPEAVSAVKMLYEKAKAVYWFSGFVDRARGYGSYHTDESTDYNKVMKHILTNHRDDDILILSDSDCGLSVSLWEKGSEHFKRNRLYYIGCYRGYIKRLRQTTFESMATKIYPLVGRVPSNVQSDKVVKL